MFNQCASEKMQSEGVGVSKYFFKQIQQYSSRVSSLGSSGAADSLKVKPGATA